MVSLSLKNTKIRHFESPRKLICPINPFRIRFPIDWHSNPPGYGTTYFLNKLDNLFPSDASTGKDGTSKGEELKLPVGPITRSQAKKLKSAFQNFVGQFIEDRLGGPALDIKNGFNGETKEKDQPINLIQVCGLEVEA